jgi:8-amino-7-oxononanoate synthase
MPFNVLNRRMAARLSELEEQDQMRTLACLSGVNLCSNDYLGLSIHPLLRDAVREGVEHCERMGATGSRLLSGHYAIWDELEGAFAAYAGTEAALFFNSGFSANTSLLSSVLGPEDVVFSDRLNHASIIDGIRLSRAQKIIYPHGNLTFLEDALRRFSQNSRSQMIVTESIFSMDGDRAPLRTLFELAERYGAEIIVDEAHATGACGPGGRGLVAELGLERRAFAIVHTCGKALASAGAFVSGTLTLKRFLINHARSFIFSTGLPPYLAFQIRAALSLAASMDAERHHLSALAQQLRGRLSSLGFGHGLSDSHIVPFIIPGAKAALGMALHLRERGFAVRAIRPPTVPPGAERLRLSLTAKLAAEDIDRFTEAVSCSHLVHG